LPFQVCLPGLKAPYPNARNHPLSCGRQSQAPQERRTRLVIRRPSPRRSTCPNLPTRLACWVSSRAQKPKQNRS